MSGNWEKEKSDLVSVVWNVEFSINGNSASLVIEDESPGETTVVQCCRSRPVIYSLRASSSSVGF